MTTHDRFFEHNGHKLSHREAQILVGVAQHLTAKQIVDNLCIASGTVKRHKENIRNHFDLQGKEYYALQILAEELLPELQKWV